MCGCMRAYSHENSMLNEWDTGFGDRHRCCTARARLGTLTELGEHEIDVREQWRDWGCALSGTASIGSAKQTVSATG